MAPYPCPRCRSAIDGETVGPFAGNSCPICGYHPATEADRSHPTSWQRSGPSVPTIELKPRREVAAAVEPAFSSLVYGPYRVLRLIGKGGMGLVYCARHEETGQEVALKTVRVHQRDILHWFRREMHAMNRVRHRGVVPIFAVGQTQGLPWYAMELLAGKTLREHLQEVWGRSIAQAGGVRDADFSSAETTPWPEPSERRAGAFAPNVPCGRPMPLSPADLQTFLTLIARLCAVLAYLHGEGIVHRDLKPPNIFVRPDGTPVLFDLGLVSYFGAGGRESLQNGGKMEGTPAYMAPEQIRGEYVDARADLYAVGCMLYEGVTGRVPFLGETAAALLDICVREEPVPPSRLVQGVPQPLEELILRLLVKRPRERIGHARAVLAALSRLGAEVGDWAADRSARDYLYRPGFVGREAVLERLESPFRGGSPRPGRCLFLRGRSGAGKTRTIMELGRRLEQIGRKVLLGECLPLGAAGVPGGFGAGSRPLHPFRAVLQAVADACLELGAAETDRLLGPRLRLLARCEPSLAGLPGQERYAEPPRQSHDDIRIQLMDALAETLSAFASGMPFVLLLDDLQWADELTLKFLALLQRGVWEAPGVGIVGAYRSEDDAEIARVCGADFADFPIADLEPLEDASLHAILRELLGSDEPDQRFLRQLAQHSRGNPFFVAELLRTAIAREMLCRDEDGRWRVRPPWNDADDVLPLPASLADLILHRLEGLSPAARQVLEMVAVFGREVEADLLEGAGLLDAGWMTALQELLAAQMVEEHPSGVFRFLHDKLREVVYAQMPVSRRHQLHQVAAVALETCYAGQPEWSRPYPTLAHHWHQSIANPAAEPDRVNRALDYLEKSAEQTTQSGLQLEAVAHGLTAARLLGADIPQTPEAITAAMAAELERIRGLLADRPPLDLLNLPPSDDLKLDRLIGLLQAIHPAAHTSNQYQLSAFLAVKNLCLTLTHGRGRTAPSVYALYTIVARNVLGDSRLADAFSRLAIAEDARQGRRVTPAVLFLRSWFVGHWVAPFRDSLDICRRAIEAGQTSGEVLYRCFSHANYVICLAASGASLAEVIRAAEEHMNHIGRRVLIAHFHCVLERQLARALAGLTRSPLSLSDESFDEERDLASICRTNNSTQIGYYHICRLKLHSYRGETRLALASAERALAVLPSFQGTPGEMDLVFFRALTLAQLAADAEDAAQADHWNTAQQQRAVLAHWAADCPANFEHKLHLLDGEIARAEGRGADACRCYTEAARSADAFGFTPYAALAYERIGGQHNRAGASTHAEAAFREALSRYRAWGAATLADRLVDEPCDIPRR